LNLLLVDGDPALRNTLDDWARENRLHVLACDQAELDPVLSGHTVDLAVINWDAPHANAVVGALMAADREVQILAASHDDHLDHALRAVRAGCRDVIRHNASSDEWSDRLGRALDRRRADLKDRRQHEKLRRLCKRLNRVRREVTHQVDILCNDLVSAYQELAGQMQQAIQSSEYQAQLRDELDLETVIRRSLEYILEKAGPTNAAIFLPSTFDEYTLGGYINYDCTGESADILLQHLADTVAPRLAERLGPLHITDNDTLTNWLADDATYLLDSHLLAFPCRFDDEALSIVILFRDASQPFDATLIETCTGMAPIMAQSLERIIRIHHRHLPDDDAPAGFEPADEVPF